MDLIPDKYTQALQALAEAENGRNVQENALLAIAYVLCDIASEIEQLRLTIGNES